MRIEYPAVCRGLPWTWTAAAARSIGRVKLAAVGCMPSPVQMSAVLKWPGMQVEHSAICRAADRPPPQSRSAKLDDRADEHRLPCGFYTRESSVAEQLVPRHTVDHVACRLVPTMMGREVQIKSLCNCSSRNSCIDGITPSTIKGNGCLKGCHCRCTRHSGRPSGCRSTRRSTRRSRCGGWPEGRGASKVESELIKVCLASSTACATSHQTPPCAMIP